MDSEGGQVRVVLVGRTGLEGVMRRRGGITLLRPRDASGAIGELVEDLEGSACDRTIVLAGIDSVPSGRSAAFTSALRLIDDRIRVLGVDRESLSGFDGIVSSAASADEVLAWASVRDQASGGRTTSSAPVPATLPTASRATPVRSTPEPRTPAPVPAREPMLRAVPPPAPASTQTLEAPAIPAAPMGHQVPEAVDVHAHTPLGALLAGRDPIEAALGNLRVLMGTDVRFITNKPGPEWDAAQQDGVEVSHAGRVLGRLLAGQSVSRDDLRREASWLAGWVMLSLQQEQLKRAAFTDELTGAWNRRYFQRFLSAAIEQARATRQSVSLLVFDIDDFKRYNDQYGHPAGDEILSEAARLITSVIRPTDRVCRIGGDEFAVIFHDPEGPRNPASPNSGKGLHSIVEVARRFQKQICQHRFPKLGGEAPGTLTISGGMATYPWDGKSVEELLERADALAIQSKRQGKNAITLGPGAVHVCGHDELASLDGPDTPRETPRDVQAGHASIPSP